VKATGQKALFVNPGFTKRIIGLKDEESDAILKLLFKVDMRKRYIYVYALTVRSTYLSVRTFKCDSNGMIAL
jgi:alpha-ketoglutarate-dependent taurine dioxygenase